MTFNDGLLPNDPDSCSLPKQGPFMQWINVVPHTLRVPSQGVTVGKDVSNRPLFLL